MDGKRFDDCTKALATGVSRRQVIKGLAGGALAALFGVKMTPVAEAATCRELGEACKPGASEPQAGACCAGTPGNPTHLICQKVAETGADRCECDLEGGFVRCGGRCVAINCPGGGQLDTTTCTCVCPPGTTPCGPNNACVTNCTSPFVLNPNTCTCVCPSGTEQCGGQCLSPCPAGQQRQSDCTCACPSGTELCNGQCVAVCPTGQNRNPSTCACECPSGQELCNGQCVNLCPAGLSRQPNCTCGCPSGTVLCQGACVSNVCTAPGQVFNEETCSCACPPGQVFCGGACHNPSTECAGFHNKIFNIECCNQGANPCQNPGQPSGRCKA